MPSVRWVWQSRSLPFLLAYIYSNCITSWQRMLSVEAALLHNFVWHVTWTWPSHNNEQRSQLRALQRFHLISGTVSMAGNTGLMWVLVGTAQMQPVLANLVSIGACSIVNFVVCERVVFGSPPASSSLRHTEVRAQVST